MNMEAEIESAWDELVEGGYPQLFVAEQEKHVSPRGEDITYCRIAFNYNNKVYGTRISSKYDIKEQVKEYLIRCRIRIKDNP